jgi:hypothetical protein
VHSRKFGRCAYSNGKAGDDDEGDLRLQVAHIDEIERLPKTRNGAIIVLGKTELWARDDYSDPPLVFRLGVAVALSVGVAMGPPKVMADSSSFVDCDQTYSTREAAEKARKS